MHIKRRYHTEVLPKGPNVDSVEIPVLIPRVPQLEKLTPYLRRIDKSRNYSNFGELNSELRTRVALEFGIPDSQVQTACNATLALQGAIITSKAEHKLWQIPAWTFIATAQAVRNAGKDFCLVDIDEKSWRGTLSNGEYGHLDVLPFGDDVDWERIDKIDPTTVIIDAAASYFSLKRKLPNTDFDYAIVISLHATKLLPAGEGALFLTNSQEWAERFRKWTNFGFDWNRNPISEGTNAKMSEYSCAVALASLDQSHELMSDQAKNLEVARKVTSQFNLSCQPALEKNLISPYWIIDFKSEKMREVVEKRLKEASIDSRKWWGKGCLSLIDKTDHYIFPNTVRLATSSLGLPMHSFLKSSDFLRIEEVLNSIFGRGI